MILLEQHECLHEEEIHLLREDVAVLKNSDIATSKILETMDAKLDKIVWFIIGACVSIAAAFLKQYG